MWWGKKEGGPAGRQLSDPGSDGTLWGKDLQEKARTAMQKLALSSALDKAGLSASALDYILAGDLLSQCSVRLRLRRPRAGRPLLRAVRRACSTMAEA
ncbi:MAG: hypothetical protein ACLRWQ_18750 [Flavonifractor plautii]